MLKKKLYLVKTEVMATSIHKAISTKGKVYSVELVVDQYQPDEKKNLGFKTNKNV